ncbi:MULTISPECIES: cell wall hydrolase [unclassified Sphingobium]|uniref:cell wall hydrolase n=1 Tax=unclassified Sphingobium TaxID=2611147 RepID=UPI000D15BC95|nr:MULTISPECIES: cell wall hydrolase [unclassified Sphingobium]MBG6118275.1 spore germination cell wall hydrolase CwlJ-like protein [Sphingobium sp. JAI105]PSO11558.1 cell wall hydrolase [Sphingobium sp. AEW4]TWD07855.1 cell wall hydrolase [Sphingobium sp. AEW010]TWD24875.1 cell wall hydrolase [Sphingobium sp. AEW013]TWD26707.1 cell wall hydrolase [Sphingobium sp. AEW001]
MSFRLRAAIIVAFALSATAAVTASDMSIAGESIHSVASLSSDDALTTAPAVAPKPATITFAAPREIVQPLASASKADLTYSTESDMQASSLAALVDAHGDAEAVDGDMKCLAGAVYFESKGESLEGQLAVARVIINRAKSGRFADSLCGVVYQPSQFSFVRGHGMPPIRMESNAWRQAVAIAQIAMDDSWNSRAEGALFFHARRVSPGWGKAKLAMIDNHIFYR